MGGGKGVAAWVKEGVWLMGEGRVGEGRGVAAWVK